MNPPRKILIARLSSIGDIILTTPLVRCVRQAYPDASITFLVKKKFSSLVSFNPNISEVIEFDDVKGRNELRVLARKLRREQFDWFIDIHRSLRTKYIRLNVRFGEVTSYHKRILLRTLLIKLGINRFKSVKPVFLRYFEAVESHGINYDNNGTEVFYSDDDRQTVERFLIPEGFIPQQKMVVICPGASYSNKQWLPERFAQLADRLVQNNGVFIVFLGGPSDTGLCGHIITMMKNRATNFAGRLTLLQSAALLNKSSLVITNDSGMMHLAQSQKRPVAAIFGATSRELGFFPLPEKSIVVEKEMPCRPCTHKGLDHCPRKHFNCMRLITTNDVIDAVEQMLAELSGSVIKG
ncbi:MAG TPA: lipopolysaccharide heptosyltransferase II [Bacteroidales bacterium]|nr:lipopolysaccharide heptosyltransferase II [Bacteroidales bacterium]HPT02495.1 lipopolysaccharide heptosyltransferase II [Bacteroidales bacterium]